MGESFHIWHFLSWKSSFQPEATRVHLFTESSAVGIRNLGLSVFLVAQGGRWGGSGDT